MSSSAIASGTDNCHKIDKKVKENKNYRNHRWWKVTFKTGQVEAMDITGKTDCYLRIGKPGKKDATKWLYKTKVQEKTLTPEWSEEIRFVVSPKCQEYIIEAWDKDLIKDEYMGCVKVNIPKHRGTHNLYINDKKGKSKGTISVSFEDEGWFI
ncbi:hypothetical protein CYY_004109 [Polysphondylium violaceum]|uniref:C2 domain-containing protein n=1 Tax=Polysphondylium violaceum TaxID=133409 RepID=A0A8J4PVS1_9MYCE|nr:hypothetical protein CYY_004109 [Polysphondylium violaceum]